MTYEDKITLIASENNTNKVSNCPAKKTDVAQSQVVHIAFIENIKRLRKEHGYTQKSFAEKIGRDRQSYQRVELGISQPTLKYMCDIADGFGVNVVELLTL